MAGPDLQIGGGGGHPDPEIRGEQNFRLFLLLVGSGPKNVNAERKIGQFFADFFHILTTRKTALQLNRTATLQPSKKNAHVILFTNGRAS